MLDWKKGAKRKNKRKTTKVNKYKKKRRSTLSRESNGVVELFQNKGEKIFTLQAQKNFTEKQKVRQGAFYRKVKES